MAEISNMLPSLMVEGDGGPVDGVMEVISRRQRREIWLAVRDGRKVALKAIPEHLRSHPEEVASLRKEYLLGLRIEADGVVRVYGYKTYPELGPVIEMEYIDGKPLNEYLASCDSLGLAERHKLACEIAAALEAIHRAGVSHRDLKPDNILISSKSLRPKIIDFGNADSDEFVLYKNSAGTERYGAPEQQVPSQGGMASDVYSFGKILDDLLPEGKFLKLRNACKAQDAAQRPDMAQIVRQLGDNTDRFRLMKRLAGVIAFCVITAITIGYVRTLQTAADTDDKPAETPQLAVDERGDVSNSDVPATEIEPQKSAVEAKAVSTIKSVTEDIKESEPTTGKTVDSVVDKYIVEADEINARYGAITYDDIYDPEVMKTKAQLRIQRGEEHYKLADKMERELTLMGMDRRQCADANLMLWNHIIKETNRIDGADEIRDKTMKNYGITLGAE